jgi:transposase
MPDVDLFQRALGLEKPWEVVDVGFDAEQKRLDLRLDFAKGAKFPCPECGREGCSVHDTEPHTWRHMNFFQQRAARRLVVSPAQPGGTRR